MNILMMIWLLIKEKKEGTLLITEIYIELDYSLVILIHAAKQRKYVR